MLGQFKAKTFDELFEGIRKLPLSEYIGKYDAFPNTGHSLNSVLKSIPACQKIIKKAMAVNLCKAYGLNTMPESGAVCQIRFSIMKDEVLLMLDSSGTGLHKRGYRPVANAAPLRETLAAAICLTSRVREDVMLWDPCCGSGTIIIEGAMIATRRAPGLERSFAGESFGFLPSELWENAREEARCAIINDSHFMARGSDINPDCITLTKENARRAGVLAHIELAHGDMRKIRKPVPDRKGTIICNPPYGERMLSMRDAERLYRDMGTAFRAMEPWQVYVLTSCEYFEKLYGRRADKVRKLYNGTIPAYLYQFFNEIIRSNYRNF